MMESGYTNYIKSTSWLSCLSVWSRGTEQIHDQIMPPSPESSGITFASSNDGNSHSTFVTPSPSPSSSTSSSSSTHDRRQHQYQPNPQHVAPLNNNYNYFINRPSPTQRRSPGRNRQSSTKDDKSSRTTFLNKNCDTDRSSMALDSLVQETLAYFADPSSALSKGTYSNDAYRTKELVEKLKSQLITPITVHPSLLKLSNDVLAYMNEAPPLTNELHRLKPKLEVCLLIHDKSLN